MKDHLGRIHSIFPPTVINRKNSVIETPQSTTLGTRGRPRTVCSRGSFLPSTVAAIQGLLLRRHRCYHHEEEEDQNADIVKKEESKSEEDENVKYKKARLLEHPGQAKGEDCVSIANYECG